MNNRYSKMKYIVGCGGTYLYIPSTHETKAGRLLSSMPGLQRESRKPGLHREALSETTQNNTKQKTHKKVKYSHLRSFCEVPLLTRK